MKRVTIYDVAKEAGVSLATVSRVINGLEIVREETRVKVETAIDKLGYKPNAIAQGLALQKTTTIALLVPEASFGYTGQIINGLIDVAKIYKYNIMLHTMTEGIVDIKDVIDDIIKSRVDGVIIYNDKLMENELAELNKYQFPIVIIGNKMSDKQISSVYVDIEKAVYELTMQKIQMDPKNRVAVIQDRKNDFTTNQMVSGVQRAYQELGIDDEGYIEIPLDYRRSYDYFLDHIESMNYNFLIANRDSQAISAMNAAHECNMNIPEDLEIVCLIDTKYNSMVRPRLSSFAIPSYDLGAVAMRVLTKMLNEDEVEDKEIELSYLYTPRQSTKN
ncbi:LacI family DNA-binding transcriptional regulator [Erysipelothrix rhusiopathiae]|uniref:Transcriptional regulator, LacI family n=1 Tax=Erysipelothrix rhusiopathiae ATCC 19414 TaxID=525280 RepID=E7FU38_ERYRH|nr:LacI family DNA-binding transcriptional regulator [Erysipelothrix rhusiopathiae]EFY09349.1 transcriptional regulator, LacI family [Erysipelothrix rhusiopathiae ATCC 19414]MDE8257070.1 LacI family DNA-binding transcriptional regulator [Erysipelothrix rhusiopathiae]STD01331.1 Catabolite control protein [Erysipelothrix rhusiopathiae]VEH84168.1 Catabolite control protein [Erysipelothrix rhusiopathiae]